MKKTLYKENMGMTHVNLRPIRELIRKVGEDKVYRDLEEGGSFSVPGYMNLTCAEAIVPCHSPFTASLNAYSHEWRNGENPVVGVGVESYLTIMSVEGDSQREVFDGLIKLIEEETK
jgi:hypothetical protein